MSEKTKDILEFWFGGDVEMNYATKWFPSGKKQKCMDEEIKREFGDTLENVLEAKDLSSWTSNPRDTLALIVLLDQFSRHIYRGQRESAPQLKSDSLALCHADAAIRKGWIRGYSSPELVFALMPLRHTPTSERLHKVLQICDSRIESSLSYLDLLKKFRKTSFLRLQHLEGKSGPGDGDILEHHEFEADESNVLKNDLVKCMHEYLLRKLNCEGNEEEKEDNDATMSTLVSLSGGVDSMVISKILVILRDRVWNRSDNKLPPLQVHCVHIDYANRSESGEEASFVKRWCEKHGMKFHIRRIDEYTRGVTNRDIYEKQTRKIRYDTYKQLLKEISCRGVIFGHHCGDVQENVISNFFKANSNLSGMRSTGLVNKVEIWRPLLSYRKTNIIDFAHQYGVPYFKDTTPKWSTRGKMRNQLIPLLKDMFGPGVLTKLSTLAADSDATSDMVEEYMFEPLMRRVVRSSVCVRLDCSDYLNRPLVFWKEILKRIFHSVQSSCPANKAILNFYESLHPVKKRKKKRRGKDASLFVIDPSELCDETAPLDKDAHKKTYWPTLKKDHHALLHKGIFYIFDKNVRFLKSPQRRLKESDEEEPTTMNISLSSLSSSCSQVKFRGWSLSICYSESKEESKMTLDDFASGVFAYTVAIPKSSSSIIIEFHHRKAPFMADSIPPRVRQLIPSVRHDGNSGRSREEQVSLLVKCTFSP